MAGATLSKKVDYPTSDGKPMAETDWHLVNMMDSIQTLKGWFEPEPRTYVAGNMLMFYVPGNKRKHVSPDVFVVKGIAKHMRPNYLIWEEGKAPDAMIEMTSKSTAKEDVGLKFELYRDVLKVQEYFLFDPREEYLDPSLQGFRLSHGKYLPIKPIDGRLPSKVLGLHLEHDGWRLRFYDPQTKQQLLTPSERAVENEKALRAAQSEIAQMQRELDALRRRNGK